MTNIATYNPLYVDAAAAVTTKRVIIQAIGWVGNDTAGDDIAADDDVEFTDVNGNILFSKRAAYAGDDAYISYPDGLPANGITCSAIDGGIAFIYIR